jgi:hypothetical protein
MIALLVREIEKLAPGTKEPETAPGFSSGKRLLVGHSCHGGELPG